ncbi:MAG: hypothetical protein CMK89_05165 [Pseudomonadales bacterium]|nr:hypothetical protein [Pseudomonadales bacterium]RLU00012.1 MAG: TonB family protein [Ketobacter sp.]
MIARWLGGVLLGSVVTLLLFSFMLKLVMSDSTQELMTEAVTQMQFIELPEEPPPPEAESDTAMVEDAVEPMQTRELIPVLSAPIQAPTLTRPDVAAQAPALQDFAPSIAGPQSNWSVPVSGDGFAEGEKGKGYMEVVPLATRRPNIPERAWQHKINGWVRVAFRLTREGRTADVRVLDAHPGGVFEDNVVRAVEDWLYDMRDLDIGAGAKGELILTQKIELFWRDYPDNSPYLD